MLVDGEPRIMVGIGDGSGWLSVGGSSPGGGGWFRNGAIDISPKLGTMKVWFELPKPGEVIGFSKFGELSSVLGGGN